MRLNRSDKMNRKKLNENVFVPAPSRKIYNAKNITYVTANAVKILPTPFFRKENVSLREIKSSPKNILIRVFLAYATGISAEALIPMSPSANQSTESPVAKAISMQM